MARDQKKSMEHQRLAPSKNFKGKVKTIVCLCCLKRQVDDLVRGGMSNDLAAKTVDEKMSKPENRTPANGVVEARNAVDLFWSHFRGAFLNNQRGHRVDDILECYPNLKSLPIPWLKLLDRWADENQGRKDAIERLRGLYASKPVEAAPIPVKSEMSCQTEVQEVQKPKKRGLWSERVESNVRGLIQRWLRRRLQVPEMRCFKSHVKINGRYKFVEVEKPWDFASETVTGRIVEYYLYRVRKFRREMSLARESAARSEAVFLALEGRSELGWFMESGGRVIYRPGLDISPLVKELDRCSVGEEIFPKHPSKDAEVAVMALCKQQAGRIRKWLKARLFRRYVKVELYRRQDESRWWVAALLMAAVLLCFALILVFVKKRDQFAAEAILGVCVLGIVAVYNAAGLFENGHVQHLNFVWFDTYFERKPHSNTGAWSFFSGRLNYMYGSGYNSVVTGFAKARYIGVLMQRLAHVEVNTRTASYGLTIVKEEYRDYLGEMTGERRAYEEKYMFFASQYVKQYAEATTAFDSALTSLNTMHRLPNQHFIQRVRSNWFGMPPPPGAGPPQPMN